jgi:hypothetical protein
MNKTMQPLMKRAMTKGDNKELGNFLTLVTNAPITTILIMLSHPSIMPMSTIAGKSKATKITGENRF